METAKVVERANLGQCQKIGLQQCGVCAFCIDQHFARQAMWLVQFAGAYLPQPRQQLRICLAPLPGKFWREQLQECLDRNALALLQGANRIEREALPHFIGKDPLKLGIFRKTG